MAVVGIAGSGRVSSVSRTTCIPTLHIWAGTSPEPPLPREPPCLCSSSEHFRHEAPASRLHPEAVLPPELSSVNQLGCWVAGFRGGPGRSAQGRNMCVCQIMSEPGGLEGAHGASALAFSIAIMKSLPKINAAWVMSDLFRLEGEMQSQAQRPQPACLSQ